MFNLALICSSGCQQECLLNVRPLYCKIIARDAVEWIFVHKQDRKTREFVNHPLQLPFLCFILRVYVLLCCGVKLKIQSSRSSVFFRSTQLFFIIIFLKMKACYISRLLRIFFPENCYFNSFSSNLSLEIGSLETLIIFIFVLEMRTSKKNTVVKSTHETPKICHNYIVVQMFLIVVVCS